MDMNIEITPVEKYEVKVDGKSIGEFELDSSWEGFVKLKNENGVIIANDERTLIDKMFDGILRTEEKALFSVLKITPSLIPIDSK